MVILPIPFIRSIGVGGLLIPIVSVIAAFTLLPAMLAILGTGINRVRVMPNGVHLAGRRRHRLLGALGAVRDPAPGPMALIGIAIVALVLIPGLHLNPSEAQAKNLPGRAPRSPGATRSSRRHLAGAIKPFVDPRRERRHARPGRGQASPRSGSRRASPAPTAPRAGARHGYVADRGLPVDRRRLRARPGRRSQNVRLPERSSGSARG